MSDDPKVSPQMYNWNHVFLCGAPGGASLPWCRLPRWAPVHATPTHPSGNPGTKRRTGLWIDVDGHTTCVVSCQDSNSQERSAALV